MLFLHIRVLFLFIFFAYKVDRYKKSAQTAAKHDDEEDVQMPCFRYQQVDTKDAYGNYGCIKQGPDAADAQNMRPVAVIKA